MRLALLLLTAACTTDTTGPFAGLDPGDGPPVPEGLVVTAVAETESVSGLGDAADDPAIWVDPVDPAASRIVATDKSDNGGLNVYDLDGVLVQFESAGPLNNVDVRPGFVLDGAEVALVVASHTTDDRLAVYALDPATGTIRDVAGVPITTSPGAYGACLYHSAVDGGFYAFVDTEVGVVQQFRLFADGATVSGELVRAFCTQTQPEGCAADDDAGLLYIGEEGVGVWKFAAEVDGAPPGSELPACDTAIEGALVDNTTDGHLTADVEGIAVVETTPGAGYLLVSSQGSHTYVIYERGGDNAFVKEFAVWGGGDACLDGTSNTDGVAAVAVPLGPNFPEGLVVVQDGFNADPVDTQNFKLLRWDHVMDDVYVEAPSECHLSDFGGTSIERPPGPERTPAFCDAFCAKCDACYAEGDPAFAEGDCHYVSPKPIFDLEDCLTGCNGGFIPQDTSPLQTGWETWDCIALDDAL